VGESVRWVYRILGFLLAPFWLLFLGLKQRGALRLRDRLGLYPHRADGPLWVQAVSVGEVRIALRLAQRLLEAGLPVALTSTTAAGLRVARKEAPAAADPRAFVLDLSDCVSRALRRLRPRALVLVETELWPELLRDASMAGIPTFVVNGRLSERAFQRTLRFKSLYEKALAQVYVAAQSEEHATRFKMLGASPGRVFVLGNLKYDLAPPANFEAVREELRAFLPPAAPLWTAGSVREGEEALVLKAHAQMKREIPGARLVLAPRHLERLPTCEEEAAAAGLCLVRRSGAPVREWDVLLLDTIGELWSAYDLGAVAFVGGSLVPLGGQNVLEPAFLGKPVLFGPHTHNFKEDAERLAASGGGFRVESSPELAWRVAAFLRDPALARASGERARSAVERHRGAVDRAAVWLSQNLPSL
jgi:3-deoxy-D-manno-octulosonic-acid transferase